MIYRQQWIQWKNGAHAGWGLLCSGLYNRPKSGPKQTLKAMAKVKVRIWPKLKFNIKVKAEHHHIVIPEPPNFSLACLILLIV